MPPRVRPTSYLPLLVLLAAPLLLTTLCNCGDSCEVAPSTFTGALLYGGIGLTQIDGGATSAATSSTSTVGGIGAVARVDSFTPSSGNKSNDDGGYCGAKSFTISLGPACTVHAALGTTYYDNRLTFLSAGAALSADSPCVIAIDDRTELTLAVESGVAHFTPENVEIDLTGTSSTSMAASLHFEGLQQ